MIKLRLLGIILMFPSVMLHAEEPSDVSFNRDVLPILAENCFACHGFDAAAREADLRLDTRRGAIGSEENPGVIVPGDPNASEMISRITSDDPDTVMPPADSEKRLSAEQREILKSWVSQGASYDKHWSFMRPNRPEPPTVPAVDHPIDRFIQSRLAAKGLKPSPPADPATLIRRVSLDLIGLPPAPEEIDAFEKASASDPDLAWRELVDRLLDSPHYGERWGRWWLDQARYADSNGYSIDGPRSIWKYRDWVIDAFNADMPFNQFTIEQLAGDLLPGASVSQQVATGFHRNTQINQEGGIDREQFRVDSVFDRVATTGTVWLGLTIGCAQCHDHKFDPIEQKEFYRLFAFLNNQDEPNIKVYPEDVDVSALTARQKDAQSQLTEMMKQSAEALSQWETGLAESKKKELSGELKKILGVEAKKRNFVQKLQVFLAMDSGNDEFAKLKQHYEEITKRLNDAPTTMVLRESAKPRKTHVLVKGDFTRPAEEVTPGTPAVLHPFEPARDVPNRLDLARWIASEQNPLTARVMVNRVWQQYFGRGLVATDNDFGLLGSRPTHPQLLDWLACEWMDRGWSLKEMHRLIVGSRTYQQSSVVRDDLMAVDPENRWWGRQERLRLDAEIVRDVALSASGLMTDKMGGPPVYPPIPQAVMSQGQVRRAWRVSEGEDRYRRGLYTFIYRATPPPSLSVFDAPDGFSTCTRRNRSNTPLQSLTLMNDAAYFEFAEALRDIIERDSLEIAFRRCTSRRPDQEELAVLRELDT